MTTKKTKVPAHTTFPAFFYGPKGEAVKFNTADEIPEGWTDAPQAAEPEKEGATNAIPAQTPPPVAPVTPPAAEDALTPEQEDMKNSHTRAGLIALAKEHELDIPADADKTALVILITEKTSANKNDDS